MGPALLEILGIENAVVQQATERFFPSPKPSLALWQILR